MKKIFIAILLVSAIGATSCKKDAETAPTEKALKVNGGSGADLDKSNVGTWD